MKLYHIHTKNKYDDLFYEGSSFIVGDKPNYFRDCFLKRNGAYLDHSEIRNGLVVNHYSNLSDILDINLFNDMTLDEKERLFKIIHNYVKYSSIDFREMILEDVRLRYFNDRPSRNRCMWLTDEKSLPFWLGQLKEDKELYKVDVDGNIFVSTDRLLPDGYMPRELIYNKAFDYWDPRKENLEYAKDKEYLFEGRVRILKRVK